MNKFRQHLLIFTVSLFYAASLYAAPNKGKEIYTKSCVVCHTPNGAGLAGPAGAPNLTILKKVYAKEQMAAILSGKRKSVGSTTMKAVLASMALTPVELNAALDYALKLPEAPSHNFYEGNAIKGKKAYEKCIHCHGTDAMGYHNAGLPAPRLLGQSNYYIFEQLKHFKQNIRGTETAGALQMQALMKDMSEDEYKDIAAYICSLDDSPTKIQDLTFKVYKGKWSKLPNFAEITPVKSGKLSDGLLDLQVSEQKNGFGMAFEGYLEVPTDGEYKFTLRSDDGSKLYLNDRSNLIINNDGIHGANDKTSKYIQLKKGRTKILVDYFDGAGQKELVLSWSLKNHFTNRYLSATTSASKKGKGPKLPPKILAAQDGKALLMRNFLNNKNARSIGVAYPGKMNLIFDATNMSFVSFWNGQFFDIAPMWHRRGTSHLIPLSDELINYGTDLQFAELANKNSKWPLELNRNSNVRRTHNLRFRGYSLDKNRYPTFEYSLGETQFHDFFTPNKTKTGFIRTIKIKGSSKNLWFRVAMDKISQNGDSYTLSKSVIQLKGAQLRAIGNAQELLVPVKFTNGEATLTLQYTFKGVL
ncbi:c-type cytochrome [Lentisphaera profundi]|uniref:C-type cytochrome n=1 Tax=Lentisphaera profundi TaxID=1658616 RepID=A0ABY7VWK9_9BACT|nr:c-type cytochrome [Lentisphaera profundi]WDE98631.1 c-type cytochrome [Lentisphaera profundi]